MKEGRKMHLKLEGDFRRRTICCPNWTAIRKGRKEGREEGRMDGRMDGRMNGRKEGRKEEKK